MGLLVDIKKEYNNTMADVTDVYIRVDSLTIYPKHNAIKAYITGYVNPESGYVMKSAQLAEVKKIEPFFYTNEILNGYTTLMNRDETIPVPQTGQEPIPLFADWYTIYMYNEDGSLKTEFAGVELWDYDSIYSIFYNKIKEHEFRFENIRDVLDDPEVV